MRIVFELKRGEEPEVVLNNLYKQTDLQQGSGHHHAGDRRRPSARARSCSTTSSCLSPTRQDIVRRRTNYLLRKARNREHILLGFEKERCSGSTT